MNFKIYKYITLLLCLSLGVTACGEYEECDPPFFVIDQTPGAWGSIKAGQRFQNAIGIHVSARTTLENAKITVTYPQEIEIGKIIQPPSGPQVIQKGNTIEWTLTRKATIFHSLFCQAGEKHFTVGLTSRTDWERWSAPRTMTVSLNFKGPKCNNYPDGFYSKTIKWSSPRKDHPSEGWLEWDVAPNGYKGIWEK